MAYKALYRTYRPQKFEEVVGQTVIVKTLQNALANEKTTHAYLFSGPRGTGKTTVARILAKALNCDNGPTNEACGKCSSCREIAEGISPDVIEIDAASNNGVDEIREIREKVKFLPAGAKYKIYIIDEVHMLSQSAFNALLKTLEEPPKHVIFILATTEPQKVLPTILSRCQRYDFKALTVNEIVSSLKKVAYEEDIEATDEAYVAIAESAEGGMRDAFGFLDQAISLSDGVITIDDVNNVTGNLSYDKLIELAKYFESKDISSALKIVSELLNFGKEVNKIVSSLLQFYRDVLMFKNVSVDDFSRYIFSKEEFKKLAAIIDEKKVFYYVDVLSDVQAKLRLTTTPNIYLEVALIRMINVSADDLDLISKIKLLEEKIENIPTNISVENSGSANISLDVIEKVNITEEKINRVINELSRLDLTSWIQKVKILESTNGNSHQETNGLESRLNKLEEDLQLLKMTNNSLLSRIEDNKNTPDTDVVGRLDTIEDLLKKKPAITYTDMEVFVKKCLVEHSEKIINQKLNDQKPVVDNDLIERIEIIEENVYTLLTYYYSQIQTKKVKQKPNDNQLVLFGEELEKIEDIEKKANKEKVDFGDLAKEESLENKEDEELPKEEIKVINEEKSEVIEEEKPEDSLIEEVKKPEVTVIEKPKSTLVITPKVSEPYESGGLFSSEQAELSKALHRDTKNIQKDIQKDIKEETEELKPVQSENVPEELEKDNIIEEVENIFEEVEPENTPEELESEIADDILPVKEESMVETKEEVIDLNEPDEFERYDVCVIERILNDSQSKEARNDKERICNLWKVLVKVAPLDKKYVAEILNEGEIAAVGNNEFIIVYEEASLCNQVMRRKFKKDSLKLLYDMLGASYNYLALPIDVWKAKRTEYINEYNIGRKHPKLLPIDDPRLKVIIDREETDPGEELVQKVTDLFGGDFIEIKNRSDK